MYSFKQLGFDKGVINYEYLCRTLFFIDEKYRKNYVITCPCTLIVNNVLQRNEFRLYGFSWWINNPSYYSYMSIIVDDPETQIKITETLDIYPYHEISPYYTLCNRQIVKSSFHIPSLIYTDVKRAFIWETEIDQKEKYVKDIYTGLKDTTVGINETIEKPHKKINKVYTPTMQFIDEYQTGGKTIYKKYGVEEGIDNIKELEPDIYTQYKINLGFYKHIVYSKRNDQVVILIVYFDNSITLEKFTINECPEKYIKLFGGNI